jgi:hypothetical protein
VPNPVEFIYHIPKCAGRTIEVHIAGAMPAKTIYRPQKPRGLSRLSAREYEDLDTSSGIKVVEGHYVGRSIESHFSDHVIRRSILLREPTSHLISYYNFRMMRYLSQGLHSYGFELFYQATQRNFLTHYILKHFLEMSWLDIARLGDIEKYDIVNRFLATCWYVADYTKCDDLVASLGSELGIPGYAARMNTQKQWESRVSWTSLRMEELSATVLDRIRRENSLDQQLWETWRNARHDTAQVQPAGLAAPKTLAFVRTEAIRLAFQVARRYKRGRALSAPARPISYASQTVLASPVVE